MQISSRVLNQIRHNAALTAAKMNTYWTRELLHSWEDLEKHFKISIDPTFKSRPWDYSSFSLFREFWKNSAPTRFQLISETKREVSKIVKDDNVVTFGSVKLYPEQQGVFNALRDNLIIRRSIKAAYQDGTMGSGKTYVGSALIADMIFNQKILERPEYSILPHPFMIFTPKGVVETWKRVLDSMGLSSYVAKRKIFVFSNGEFTTHFGDMFCSEIENENTGEIDYKWNPFLTPIFALFDEAHNYNKPSSIRTKKILSMLANRPRPQVLFMSATPMEKVNDAYTFALACDTELMEGTRITKENFNLFAASLDREPHRPNREAIKRLRNVLAPYFFSFPYIKPKFKAINMVWPVDFLSDRHQAIYETAHARYLEACRKSGKNTNWGRFEIFIELNNYRKTVEPLRAGHLAARAAANYRSGKLATAIGCAFKETVAETVFQLTDKYNVPREHISLVWGGKRQYKTEQLLSEDEVESLMHQENFQKIINDRSLLKRLKITLKYLQDQHEHDESAEAQVYRHDRLKQLKLLGKQSDDKRQIEIDNFQDGTTKIVIFTLASGGVGLSFDRDKESLLPREGLFTPVYNGKEFQQVLGRLVRRASLSDARQLICMMRNTVEVDHVAPILDEKLKCIAEITNRNFDIIDLLSKTEPPEIKILRDETQATLDAEKDDTIVTDFVKEDEDDEDEDEDDNIDPFK